MTEDEPIVVTVWDSETWQFGTDNRGTLLEWEDGDWSCDCNRAHLFDDEDAPDSHTCKGAKRYLAVYSPRFQFRYIDHLNQEYPLKLREAAMLISTALCNANDKINGRNVDKWE